MYNSRLKDPNIDALFDAILALRDIDEAYRFFEDLCTVQEIKSIAQRFHVAVLLSQKRTYAQISQQTGASTATISRINRSLTFGSDGYVALINRLTSPN